jgi:predicted negative regulator of RcsB-dependent stress response
LLEDAAASGNALVVPLAQANLGGLLLNQGELERARLLLEEAAASGNPLVVPLAQTNLGILLLNQGEPERARRLLEEAIVSGNPQVVPMAQANVGAVLLGQGQLEEARPLLEEAAASGDAQAAPQATFLLGLLLRDLGEVDRARPLLQAVVETDNPMRPQAAVVLGDLLVQQGDAAGAAGAYQAAIDSGDAQWAMTARTDLALLSMDEGEPERARPLLEEVVKSEHPGRSRAAVMLGTVLAEQGNTIGAAAAYQTAIDSGDAQWAMMARIDLARLAADQGELGRARLLLEEVVKSDHPEGPHAADLLGDLLREQSDMAGASAAYQVAIDSGDAHWAMMARTDLALLIWGQGELVRAQALFEEALAADDVARLRIAGLLADLLAARGDVSGAEAAYRLAAGSEDAAVASAAQSRLAAATNTGAHRGLKVDHVRDVVRARETFWG